MKINLNIDENERRRILEMHENATKKHYLVEQSTRYKFSPESEAAREFLRRKFSIGPVHNQNWVNMTQEEKDQTYVDARTQLNSMGMNALAQEAETAGVPKDSIIKFQEELQVVAGKNLQFMSAEEKKNFVDGLLGTNTAAAWLEYMIELGKKPKSNAPVDSVKPLIPGSSKEIKPIYNVGTN
jgi:hypothetical protein